MTTTTDWPFYQDTLDCVHCGLCLPACPTYDVLGLETDSPRGRVLLVRALAEGRIEEGRDIAQHLDQCLGCLACESACPSGVRYGQILESSRGLIEQQWPSSGPKNRLRKWLLTQVVAKQGRLRLAFRFLRLSQVIGLRWLAQKVGLIPELTARLLPDAPTATQRAPLRGMYEPPDIPASKVRGTVALFTGCVMEQVFGELNRKTLDLLTANGYRVHAVEGQVCCGALLLHDGHLEDAKKLARANIAAFADADVVLHNSAGCGNAMREYGHLLDEDAARQLSDKCRDICEFLGTEGLVVEPAPYPHKVAYDDPCHLCHGQQVRSEPRALLESVPGLELVPHPESERCCGSAGIYNLNQPELAAAIGQQKAEQITSSGAAAVVTGNPGCIMQIRAHLAMQGDANSQVPVLHPVELLLPASRK